MRTLLCEEVVMFARGWKLGFVALLMVVSAGEALAIPGGTLVITDHAMDPKSKTFEKDLMKAQKGQIAKSGESWKIHFVAYLKKAAGAAEVSLVFYEIAKGKREQLNAFPIGTQDSAKIIMSEAELTSELGFKSGGKYQVLITRLIGGKEEIYAKANLELK
jgi:hypothetical protein